MRKWRGFVWILVLSVALCGGCGGSSGGLDDPVVSPSPGVTPGISPIVSPNPSGGPSPSVTPDPSGAPTPSVSPSVTPSISPSVSPTPTPTPTFTANVKDYGAKGDGITDDTAAIQKAIDAAAGRKGEVFVPDGTYMINPRHDTAWYPHGLALSSDMTLRLASGAVLKAFPMAEYRCAVVMIHLVKNVVVVGGTIEGERSAHAGIGGEEGMGVAILDASNVRVEGVTAKECWGDGFFVGGLNKVLPRSGCVNVAFVRVVADHNRRQGLSVIQADGIEVRDSIFRNTCGTRPESGIDIEPEIGINVETVKNVLITGCTFEGNAGNGLLLCLTPPSGNKASYIRDVRVERSIFRNNGKGGLGEPGRGVYMHGYLAPDKLTRVPITDVVFEDNTVEKNASNGIEGLYTERVLFRGNRVRENASRGLMETICVDSTMTGNVFERNGGTGVQVSGSTRPTVTGNTVTGNTGYGIYAAHCEGVVAISDNTVTGNVLGGVVVVP